MKAVPAAARGWIACAVAAAAGCDAPALWAGRTVDWAAAGLLAAVLVAGERLPHRSPMLPVLLTGALLLPPAAAGLAAVPGALAGPPGGSAPGGPAWLRRLWHAALYSLAAACAAGVFAAARGLLPAGPPGALPAALAAALALAAVVAVLDAGVRGARPGPWPAALVPALVHGTTALLAAVLWESAYGPPAALLVLLPVALSPRLPARFRRDRADRRAAFQALVRAVDLKDHYTCGHGERVGRAAVLIGRELGVGGARLEALRVAGVLHDLGKLGVPTRLLRKAGPLTAEERRIVQRHPEYGHELVRGIGFPGEAREAILHHHERMDGTGYPHGLTGHQIPEAARIVAVADAFDAMTSTRAYSRARPVSAALAELRRCAGSHFDPRMVAALARAVAREGWQPVDGVRETPVPDCGNVPPDHGPGVRPDPVLPASLPGGDR
ncbi:HD-GYP domain-containing protein [Streptomyces luteireticuli]|uniref:HD-GYP domain-containing protein n=1 Tax=Streptomyces luteireticuli TaxID=173858 RepID=A0ABN0Z5M5_9ACTN